MLLGLLVQQVEEVLYGERHRAAGAENHLEQVIHELLQGPLWGGSGDHRRCGQQGTSARPGLSRPVTPREPRTAHPHPTAGPVRALSATFMESRRVR